jgi:Uma2 family endonuclease
MASAARVTRYTPEQYLAMERKADFKSEYDGGFITAMAGASDPHNAVLVNLSREISGQFKNRPCRVYVNDMRLCVSKTGLCTYPEVMAVCGERQYLDGKTDTLLNPTLVVEVLSDSTESYDRGRKFDHYRQLESLREYVMIAQDRIKVERYTRQGNDWILTVFSELDDILRLVSIGCEIPLLEIYDKVEISGEAGGL